jgi:hypothetical protein
MSLTDATLRELTAAALRDGDDRALGNYLIAHRDDPAILVAFADGIAALVAPPAPDVERIEALLDGWAALPATAMPAGDPRAVLPAAALRAYGRVAVARPDWWADEIGKLRRAAADPRPLVRAALVAALRDLLAAAPARARAALAAWRGAGDPSLAAVADAALADTAS